MRRCMRNYISKMSLVIYRFVNLPVSLQIVSLQIVSLKTLQTLQIVSPQRIVHFNAQMNQ
jgi:hypothetical protein